MRIKETNTQMGAESYLGKEHYVTGMYQRHSTNVHYAQMRISYEPGT